MIRGKVNSHVNDASRRIFPNNFTLTIFSSVFILLWMRGIEFVTTKTTLTSKLVPLNLKITKGKISRKSKIQNYLRLRHHKSFGYRYNWV